MWPADEFRIDFQRLLEVGQRFVEIVIEQMRLSAVGVGGDGFGIQLDDFGEVGQRLVIVVLDVVRAAAAEVGDAWFLGSRSMALSKSASALSGLPISMYRTPREI